MTSAEFAALPDDDESKLELIDGEVCVVSGGPVHETVKGNVIVSLAGLVATHKMGVRFQSETRYYLTDIETFQPDVSLVLSGSLDPKGEGRITAVPDLAVEVVSSETAERLNHKVRVLLELGAKAVVVVYPYDREILIHRPDRIERVSAAGTLRIEDVLPGFAAPASVIFEGI
jgi:Uma2 family endonuclease